MRATESDYYFLSSTDPRKKVAKKEDLVGVIGFEPTAPASRRQYFINNLLIYKAFRRRPLAANVQQCLTMSNRYPQNSVSHQTGPRSHKSRLGGSGAYAGA